MTKREYQQAQQEKPIGTDGIELMRGIVRNRAHGKVNCVEVDAFTASAIVQVFDKLNDENKQKLISLTVPRAATVVFKLLNKKG